MTKEQLIALLNDMSLEEKVNQMSQVIGGFFDDDTVITRDRWQRWIYRRKYRTVRFSDRIDGCGDSQKNPEILHGKTSASYPTVIHAGHHQWLQNRISDSAGTGSNLEPELSEKCGRGRKEKRHPSVVCM